MKRIYAAGKIKKQGWRDDLFGFGRRGPADGQMGEIAARGGEYEGTWEERKFSATDVFTAAGGDDDFFEAMTMTYVGPFFASDDHGCFHGPNEHGANVSGAGCGAAYPGVSRADVHRLCLAAIDDCTDLFAWIDDPTAYGTLVEIGYARAKEKRIHVFFDEGKKDVLWDLWFAAGCGTFAWAPSALEAWKEFLEPRRDEWSRRML